MRHHITRAWLLGFSIVGMSSAHAQERRTRRTTPPNVISTNPFAMLLGGAANLEYERAVDPMLSVFFEPQLQFGFGALTNASSTDSVFGLGLAAGVRFYFSEDAPRGFYFSPQLELAYISLESRGVTGTGIGYGFALLTGYQWLVGDAFAISFAIGGRYLALDLDTTSGTASVSSQVSGLALAGRLSFGFAFGGPSAPRVSAPPPRPISPEQCHLPIERVQVCQSVHGYRFALPHPSTCAPGSTPVTVLRLTCEALERPAYHACLDAAGSWTPVVSWQACAATGLRDAPGDFIPPGRAPGAGVMPGRSTPTPAPTPGTTSAPTPATDTTVPSRDVVQATLSELETRASECLPPGAFAMRLTFASDGTIRNVEALADPVPAEVLACVLRHARAVTLPPFTREQFSATWRFVPRATPTTPAPTTPPPAPAPVTPTAPSTAPSPVTS